MISKRAVCFSNWNLVNSYRIPIPSTSSSKVPIRKVELKGTNDFFNVSTNYPGIPVEEADDIGIF